MEHHEAEQSHAVERYLLNEMSDEERDGFEGHYFDCPACAEDVVEGERLMASGRAVASETPVPLPFRARRPWLEWIPAVAAAALLLMNGLFLMPLRSGAVSSELVGTGDAAVGINRSASEPPIHLRAGMRNVLVVDLEPNPELAGYEFHLRDAAGKEVVNQAVSAKDIQAGVNPLLRSLPAGSYVLAIHGVREGNRSVVIATHEVRVQ